VPHGQHQAATVTVTGPNVSDASSLIPVTPFPLSLAPSSNKNLRRFKWRRIYELGGMRCDFRRSFAATSAALRAHGKPGARARQPHAAGEAVLMNEVWRCRAGVRLERSAGPTTTPRFG
jgi:hypothetical protein